MIKSEEDREQAQTHKLSHKHTNQRTHAYKAPTGTRHQRDQAADCISPLSRELSLSRSTTAAKFLVSCVQTFRLHPPVTLRIHITGRLFNRQISEQSLVGKNTHAPKCILNNLSSQCEVLGALSVPVGKYLVGGHRQCKNSFHGGGSHFYEEGAPPC